ncbi:3D-(3,5/4)-trihydroxycyclohexane-1,2-dione acylhydrolase (decyclizing) [Porticoccus sp. W117]|uniref:3D-(3,5/4)-trihydroxycyclohexane-1,2-dione acylhydrolase (decyclizing) n=1 Tax=Porticoccus sp. W117 TaxID=3054777 RepID=UPI00259A306E|nr:3D-(3,5/4)-trihydroxycyclohexane-1,2-dione acylhydrolase (decyclizing) [Porticoccus sp. W117]MDM3870089.1 3D-(3,5/4)-trihydroxycyclohexane-1,2-dione acylhydrolase (decyclizing) [Porticoccus sp. W117]
MPTVKLTMAQALVKFLSQQYVEIDGTEEPLIPGVWAIFGHGNVAGLGEALFHAQDKIPTYRAHNEQAMAHAAIAYAKAKNRKQVFACTTSIGPGATNMVTAAALAHVNRLPVLLLVGDTFATRMPDPVLQQLEDFSDPTISVNDCFKPVSRFWDRITRPEQLIHSLPRVIQTLLDPAECGPVTLSLPQDVQAMAYEFPENFFKAKTHRIRRPEPDLHELKSAIDILRHAKAPLIVAGGGVKYSDAGDLLAEFSERKGIPVVETQAGKGSLPWNHKFQAGAVGVTGTTAANALAQKADVVLAIGTRLQDFTTASRTLFAKNCKLVGLNISPPDSMKHESVPLVADAARGLHILSRDLGNYCSPTDWQEFAKSQIRDWHTLRNQLIAEKPSELPGDAEVVGVLNHAAVSNGAVVSAAGGLPGELHKLWNASGPKGYQLEYGYSCMGYEIAGGLGAKMAMPDSDVYVLVGDGSYLMMNSEIATSVSLNKKLIIVVLDNGGFGCINRLQKGCGSAPFNNLLKDSAPNDGRYFQVDFVAHAAAMGSNSEEVANLTELASAIERAKLSEKTYTIVMKTDPEKRSLAGGAWWDVPVSETSSSPDVMEAHSSYRQAKVQQFQAVE